MEIFVCVLLMVDIRLHCWVRELIYYLGIEVVLTGKLNYSLLSLIENNKVDVLVTESGQLNGLLEDTALSFAESDVAIMFIFD